MKRSRSDLVLALAVGLAAFIVYRLTLAPTVLPADSGEFQFAAPLLGLAHPTGYPLYLLLGKAWTMLVRLGDIAFRMNLLSAVLSGAAVGVLYLLGKRLGLGIVPSLLAALILAFSYTFWSQATRAEVYALNSLFTIVLLYLAAPERGASGTMPDGAGQALPDLQGSAASGTTGEQQGSDASGVMGKQQGSDASGVIGKQQGSAALGAMRQQQEDREKRYWLPLLFVLGVSLTHHRTAMLLIPALALLAAGRRQAAGSAEQAAATTSQPTRHLPSLATMLLCLAAFLLPLLLYLYVPLSGASAPYLRLAVGGGPDLMLYQNSLGDVMALILGSVFRGSLIVPDSLHATARLGVMLELLRQQIGIAGIAVAVIGLFALLRRAPRLAVSLVLAYLAVAGFCYIYFIGDISDLFTPSYIIAILFLGAGVAFLGDVAGRIGLAPGRALVLALAAILPLAFLAGNYKALDESKKTGTRSAWETILYLPLPQRAILVSNDRDEMTPMWYLQYVEGQRRDLVGLFPQIKPGKDFATLGTLLDWLLARGQQPYLIKPMPGLEIKYHLQQTAGLTQVTGFAVSSPAPDSKPVGKSFAGVVELSSADVQDDASPGGALAVTLYWRPLAPMSENYHVFVQVVNTNGERVAGSDHRPGDAFYPTSVWNAPDVLADRHVLALPAALPAGDYALRAGMYTYPAMSRLLVTGSGATTVDVGAIHVR